MHLTISSSLLSQFADLTDSAKRNNDGMRQAKQEANESRRQIQALNCEVDALKSTVGIISSLLLLLMFPSSPPILLTSVHCSLIFTTNTAIKILL